MCVYTESIYKSSCHCIYVYEGGLKISCDDVISAVDDFYQWDPSTATPMEEVWIARWTMLKNTPHLITFYESILVSLWAFQPTLIYKPSASVWVWHEGINWVSRLIIQEQSIEILSNHLRRKKQKMHEKENKKE